MVLTPMRRGALVFCSLVLAAFCIRAALYTPAEIDVRQTPSPQISTLSLDGIALAAPDAAAASVPSAPNAWGGVRNGTQPTLSDRVVNYDIDVTLDPVKHTLDGKEKLTWRNRSAIPVRSVYLHLYLNAFESSGSTFYSERKTRNFSFRSDVPVADGEWGHIELTSTRQGNTVVPWQFVHPDGGPETDHTVVRLDLPQAVPAGESTLLNIDFKAQLPRVVARTGYFGSFHLVGQWFPKIAVLELPGERRLTGQRIEQIGRAFGHSGVKGRLSARLRQLISHRVDRMRCD